MNDAPEDMDPVDSTRPHSARIWNYWLGGKDNYPVDQRIGAEVAELVPGIVDAARATRAFLSRVVRYMAGEPGIRQFLDIGTGLPTVDNTHEVAQRVDPACRIVYVDNDPLVLAHARALLAGTPQGATAYLDADLREPDAILAAAARTLDLSRPVGLMLLGIVHHITDDDRAEEIVGGLVDALAPGSHVAIAHATAMVHGEKMNEAMRMFMERGGTPIKTRTPGQIARYVQGLETVEPGVVSCSRWRPEATPWGEPDEVAQYCVVARKPGPRAR